MHSEAFLYTAFHHSPSLTGMECPLVCTGSHGRAVHPQPLGHCCARPTDKVPPPLGHSPDRQCRGSQKRVSCVALGPTRAFASATNPHSVGQALVQEQHVEGPWGGGGGAFHTSKCGLHRPGHCQIDRGGGEIRQPCAHQHRAEGQPPAARTSQGLVATRQRTVQRTRKGAGGGGGDGKICA